MPGSMLSGILCYRTSSKLFGNRIVRYTPSKNTEMAKNRPTVIGNILRYQEQGREQVVPVGTADWYDWLLNARAFTFRASSGQFTARKEQAGNKRGRWYWKAYYRQAGKLCSAYLGKSERL